MNDIINGSVTINGHSCADSGTIINPSDTIKLKGKIVKAKTNSMYVAFHKPVGYECTHDKQKKNIYQFFKHLHHHLFSIGRLDIMTSGLLIITNDGVFANKIAHPSNEIEKEYRIIVDETIDDNHITQLQKPISIEHQLVCAKKISKKTNHCIHITVVDGKKHEVRLLVANAGLTLNKLKRIRIGSLSLGDLKPGELRHLNNNEKQQLLKNQ
jgi:23S rRNA pseudouridine2605 synthase